MQKKHLILAILVTLVWGVNFPITKLGLLSMEPFLLTGIRFTLAALPLVFLIPKPNIPFRYVVIYGFIFGLGMWGIINYGIEVGVHPGVASLLIQLSAFFTMGWGALLFKERLRATQLLGAVIAFVGLVGILLSQGGGDATFGLVLVVLSAVSWSIGNVIIKLSGVKEIFSFMVWASLFPPIPLFIVSYWLHGAEPFTTLPEAINLMSVMSILFQVYLATHFSYWGWNSLLKLYPVSTVAPLSLLIPVFGLGSSMLILGEQVSFVEALSISAIIAGLAFGLYKGPVRPVSYSATR
ncbi:EamA family transporter [Alcaligenes sp. SMD-FA]|jgi:O-acetylserine/cysteine efflux transporter|uniref:EamA family transporter n=1 Tax=Alcaligenes sp. SMD-FA TaxID=2991054 RepID=UPI002227CF2D|nr:EamA family transporter [Alcaligenes sp. SMD-FA]UYY87870.1 EamA family transporter [Alcaligenes sp. SMD-FA]